MLLLLLLVFLVQLGSSYYSPPRGGKKKLNTDVLILGAGIAGISAAKTLDENNVTNFTILEAENRIGGRIKSTVLQSTDVRVELGANWIQGIDPNNPQKHPLWKIAESCGGLGGHFVKDFNNGTMHVFAENGNNISDSVIFRQRLSQWRKALDPGLPVYSKNRKKTGLPDITVRRALYNLGWSPSSSLDNLIEWYGFDLDEVAIAPENISLYINYPDETYDDFGNPNRTENYLVTDQEEGFEKIVKCLSEKFLIKNDERLILNSVVFEIDWSNPDQVCVTAREAGALKEYCASHVIVTFSLGVLQSDAIRFIPPLPASKQDAINSCTFCLYLKIFLEFDAIFWKNDSIVDNFLHVDEIRGHFVQFQPVFSGLPVLFTTVTDKIAKLVYKQSVEKTTKQIMEVLRLIYGEEIPDPLQVTIPDWWSNPFFHGTYTSPPIGCKVNLISESLGRLHFAGEATDERYLGYVHGGYFSGIDTANEILKLSRQFR